MNKETPAAQTGSGWLGDEAEPSKKKVPLIVEGGAVFPLPRAVMSSAWAGISIEAVSVSIVPPHWQGELVQRQLKCPVIGASLGSFGKSPPSRDAISNAFARTLDSKDSALLRVTRGTQNVTSMVGMR